MYAATEMRRRGRPFQFQQAVGAVDDRDDAGVTCTSAQVGDRKATRRLRCDVTNEQDSRALVRAGPEVVQRLEGPADVLEPIPLRQVLPEQVVRPVLVGGRQHLVPRPEPQRARNSIDAHRDVLHEEQALRIGARTRPARHGLPRSRPRRDGRSPSADARARAGGADIPRAPAVDRLRGSRDSDASTRGRAGRDRARAGR